MNGREEGGQYYISQTCVQERFEARKVSFSWRVKIRGWKTKESTTPPPPPPPPAIDTNAPYKAPTDPGKSLVGLSNLFSRATLLTT